MVIPLRNAMGPEARRRQLLEIAQGLFLRKGYDRTSVSEIVKAAGLSQGAFYYYFDSKMEILNALVDQILGEDLQRRLDELVEREDVDAVGKIAQLTSQLTNQAYRSSEFVGFLHEERNAHLHLKIEQKKAPLLIPPLTRIIEQGVAEGVFNTPYPTEAAAALLGAGEALNRMSAGAENWERVIEISLDLAERILGARPGTFSARLLSGAENARSPTGRG